MRTHQESRAGRPRICHIAYTFYETDNRVRRYAESLSERGDEVHILCLGDPGQAQCSASHGITLHRLQHRVQEKDRSTYLWNLLRFMAKSVRMLRRLSADQPLDLIHVHNLPDFLVFAAAFQKLGGVPLILDIHDLMPELYLTKYGLSSGSPTFTLVKWVEYLSCHLVDHVIVANDIWADRIRERARSDGAVTAILNYPDLTLFKPRPDSPPPSPDFVLLYPGTLSHHQGVDLAIRAVAQALRTCPTLRFEIYGEGREREELERLIADLKVSDRIRIHPPVPLAQMALLMQAADLCIEPKRASSFANEALSTKIFEFMGVGTPVLASDTVAHQRYFTADQVEFFKSEQTGDLASKLVDLVNDSQRRLKLARAGRAHAEEMQWSVRKQDYFQLVQTLTQKR